MERCVLDFDNPSKARLYQEFAREVFALDVSAVNVADLLYETTRKAKAAELAQALVNDREEASSLSAKLQEHTELLSARSVTTDEEDGPLEIINNLSVKEINEKVLDPKGRIKIATKSLTDYLDGGPLPGHHIVVIARPETGKTALVLTCIRSFCKQGLKGVYFGNEDPIIQVVERFQGCLSGIPKLDRLRDSEAAQKVLDASGYKYADFVEITPGTIEEIEQYVRENEPRWVIVDQLRNLSTAAENRTNQLETITVALRRMAKKYKYLGISVTQAGDSAHNKLVLDQGDIDSSNTGIPGACDVILGLGVSPQYEEQGLRKIALPKNKVSGKHVNWNVKINQSLSLIEDL